MNITRNENGKLIIIDKFYAARIRFLSEEQYMLTDEYTGIHKDLKGKVLHLVSGVDFSEVPGYHYKSDWTTFMPVDGPEYGICGIEFKYLKLIE